MAIKVNGTTVIDDSRNFTNIAGGFKTVNGTSVVGSGDISAGASTTYNAVGTYVFGDWYGSGGVTYNTTKAGSEIRPAGITGTAGNSGAPSDQTYTYLKLWRGTASTLSGTWRAMGEENYYTPSSYNRVTLWVRIS